MSQKSSARNSQRQSGSIEPRIAGKRGSSLNSTVPKQSSRSRLVLENNALATQLITGENQQKNEEVKVRFFAHEKLWGSHGGSIFNSCAKDMCCFG